MIIVLILAKNFGELLKLLESPNFYRQNFPPYGVRLQLPLICHGNSPASLMYATGIVKEAFTPMPRSWLYYPISLPNQKTFIACNCRLPNVLENKFVNTEIDEIRISTVITAKSGITSTACK